MRNKFLSTALILSLLPALALAPAIAQGKLQSWNTNQRERSQRLLSSAMTNLNKGFLDKAATLLIEATQADPTDAAPAAALGLAYVRQGKYGEALDVLKKAYQLEKNAETLLTTGFSYYLQHDYDAAIAAWTRALERDHRMSEVNGDIAYAYLRKGDFAKADEYFRLLIKARTGSQLAYQGLAVLNYLAGNLTASRRAAEHAETIRTYYPVLLLLAKLDYLQGDPTTGQKRVSAWQKAATNKRGILRSMTAIGYPSQHDFNWDPFLLENFDTGRMLMARTQKKDKNPDAKRRAPAKQGKGGDALTAAKQAQFAAPQNYYILRELALLELSNGEYSSAADHFREVLQLCPSCAIDWLHLAKALSSQNKMSEASYAVREYQRLRPTEKIESSFTALAAGNPTTIPELSPQPAEKPKRNGNDSGF